MHGKIVSQPRRRSLRRNEGWLPGRAAGSDASRRARDLSSEAATLIEPDVPKAEGFSPPDFERKISGTVPVSRCQGLRFPLTRRSFGVGNNGNDHGLGKFVPMLLRLCQPANPQKAI